MLHRAIIGTVLVVEFLLFLSFGHFSPLHGLISLPARP